MFTKIEECISFIETSKRSSTKTLEHMKKLCEVYGNPQEGLNYIHVAGTNGKGSVVSYLREILYNAKLNVGTFTSPYIECFNERITFNKKFIPDELIRFPSGIFYLPAILYYNNLSASGLGT